MVSTGHPVASAGARLQADLDEVRRIVLAGLGPRRARVWLFGSRASGTGGRGSDIDVAILSLDEPLPPEVLTAIEERLDESLVLYSVDLVDLRSADPGLRERVEREGLLWRS